MHVDNGLAVTPLPPVPLGVSASVCQHSSHFGMRWICFMHEIESISDNIMGGHWTLEIADRDRSYEYDCAWAVESEQTLVKGRWGIEMVIYR